MSLSAIGSYQTVESNLRETMRFFARAKGSCEEFDGVLMITSGINYGVFNSTLLTDPVDSLDEGEFEARAATAAKFYRDHGVLWSFWICEDLVAPSIRRRIPAILDRFGLQRLTEAPGMLTEQLNPAQRQLPDLEIRPVRDERTKNDFVGLTSVCFDLPVSICQEVYAERAWEGSYQGYVGYLQGEPVASVAAVTHAGAIGIYSLGTTPSFRGRGFAEVMLRHAVEDQGRIHRVTRTILQATKAGFRLYHKLGYRKVTQFSIYLAR